MALHRVYHIPPSVHNRFHGLDRVGIEPTSLTRSQCSVHITYLGSRLLQHVNFELSAQDSFTSVPTTLVLGRPRNEYQDLGGTGLEPVTLGL